METNVGTVDRVVRFLAGTILVIFAVFATDVPYSWVGWIGIVPILTAAIAWCPGYTVLGINTCNKNPSV